MGMAIDDPEPNNPLAPYYPSEVPNLRGSGRTWFALLFVLLILLGMVYTVVSLVFAVF